MTETNPKISGIRGADAMSLAMPGACHAPNPCRAPNPCHAIAINVDTGIPGQISPLHRPSTRPLRNPS